MLIRNAVEEIGEKPYGGGIQPPPPVRRRVNTPPNNRGISLVKDPQFVLSNQMLDAKIKQLKKDGMQNATHKPAIELEDLEKLKNSEILLLTLLLLLLTPLSLFEKRVVSHLIVLVPPWL